MALQGIKTACFISYIVRMTNDKKKCGYFVCNIVGIHDVHNLK